MGTNVYARLKLTELMKEKAIEAIKNDDYENLEEIIDYSKQFHIGKRSSGWQFLFAPQPKYYDENRKSIEEFLSRDDVIIEDEYGDHYTPEKFWKEFVDDFSDGITMQDHIRHMLNQENLDYNYIELCKKSEHISDGLRFANQEEFY